MHAARLFAVLLVGLPGVGCATVASREQIVSIDSAPRGAEIVADDGTVVGTTPALLAQTRAASHDYTVRFVDGDTRFVSACVPRTAFLVADALPALPLLVLPPPFNAIGFVAVGTTLAAIDSTNEAIFHCPDAVLVPHHATAVVVATDHIIDNDIATLAPTMLAGCPRFLVAPPAADSARASHATSAAAATALLELNTCATVVDTRAATAVFERHHVNWRQPLRAERFSRDQIHDVAFTTSATHLVQVERSDDGPARLRVIDVHTLRTSPGPALTPPTAKRTAADDDTDGNDDLLRDAVRFGVGLIPDTFVWNAAAKFLPFQPTGNERVVEQVFTNPLLATAINFQLVHLDHPEHHAPWDWTLTVGPDLLALLNGSRLTLKNDDGSTRTLTLNVIQAVVPISPRLTLFTPAGVSAVWLGAGPALIVDWDEPGYRVDWRVAAFAHAGVSHHVFLTRTIFVGVAASGNRSLQPHVLRDGVKLDWFLQTSINLGISFPNLTWDIGDWLAPDRR